MSNVCGVGNAFSRTTLAAFEDASASIVLRQIDRAFGSAGIRLAAATTAEGGTRRIQFRRYVASVDQGRARDRDRLGDALGALIAEVAASKVDFLVAAAERDGFSLVGGVFRPVGATPESFAVTRVEDLASIDDRVRRIRLLASDRPNDAVTAATSLLASVCRIVASRHGASDDVRTAGAVELANATLASLEIVSTSGPRDGAALVRSVTRLYAAIADSGEHARQGELARRDVRLAIDVAVSLTAYVARGNEAVP